MNAAHDALPGMLPLGTPRQADAEEALDVAGNALAQVTQVLEYRSP